MLISGAQVMTEEEENTNPMPLRVQPNPETPTVVPPSEPDTTATEEPVAAAPPPPVETPRPPVSARIRLDKKHPLAIRWMHWINFPVLFTMIWSGLLIYWGDSDNAYQHPHRVYHIGLGAWTLFRFFPEWVYRWLNAPYQITTGLGWHFVFMWIFALTGLLYVTCLTLSGNWWMMVPRRGAWIATAKEALQVTLYDLHLTRVHP